MVATLELEDAKDRSAGFSVDDLKWSNGVAPWFGQVRAAILACSDDIVELPRAKSVVYRAPEWFVEVIPRTKGFLLRLAADTSDLENLSPDVQEAAAWSFITRSSVFGGSLFTVSTADQLATACGLIGRTYQLMFE